MCVRVCDVRAYVCMEKDEEKSNHMGRSENIGIGYGNLLIFK